MPWIRITKDPPHDRDDWVSINVHIRKQSDGVVRVYKTDGLLDDDGEHLSTYIWEEGNFSCDCNRYLFYQRAVDADEDDNAPDGFCGEDKYRIWIVNPATGNIVYDER
jgi:hypothetical protein